MKVLFLANIPAPYSADFFNEFGKLCDLTVLYERRRASDRDKKWVTIHNKDRTYKEVFLKGINTRPDGALCVSVIKYLKNTQYDIIIIGAYYTPTGLLSIEYLRHSKTPFILKADGGLLKEDRGLKRRIKKHFISSASAWLSSGEMTKKYLLSYGAIEGNIYWYPFTSIKLEEMLPEPTTQEEKALIRRKLGIKGKRVVISVGQFIFRKGHDILLKAFSDMDSDTELYIIGGKPTPEYEIIKRNHNLNNAHFVGFKSKNELKEYYKAADLFVLATREDIWGLVINEAMASGLPVISTNKCVAATELVKDNENGFVVENEDIVDIHNKMKMILDNDDLQYYMSKSSIEIVKQYNIENMARYYNIVLQETYSKVK